MCKGLFARLRRAIKQAMCRHRTIQSGYTERCTMNLFGGRYLRSHPARCVDCGTSFVTAYGPTHEDCDWMGACPNRGLARTVGSISQHLAKADVDQWARTQVRRALEETERKRFAVAQETDALAAMSRAQVRPQAAGL